MTTLDRIPQIIMEAQEKALSPRAKVLLDAALSAHQDGDASHQTGEQTQRVDDPTSLTRYLMGHGDQDHAEREK